MACESSALMEPLRKLNGLGGVGVRWHIVLLSRALLSHFEDWHNFFSK